MVPNTFKIKAIQDFCQIIDCEHKTAPYVEKSDFLVVRTSNVKDGRLIWDDMKFTTQNGYEEWTQRAIPEYGDVLFTREAPAGEICLVPKNIKMCMGQRMVLLRPVPEKIDPLYFSLVLTSKKIKLDILKISIGSTVSRINIEDIRQLKVPVPPLDEQRKISKMLNAWEQAILITEKLLTNSQRQKKALMQQLLTGKRRFGWEGGYAYSVPQGYAKSKLGALPSAWKVDLLEKHLWFQEGPGVRNHQFTETGIKLFNGTNIQFNKIDLTNTTTHISSEEAFGIYKHFLIDEGDLLIACSGISVDRFNEKIAFALSSHLPLCMNTSTMRFKVIDNHILDIRYFQYFMQSLLFKNQIRRQATGSAQLNFGPSHVGKCFVVIPSIEEQQKIAAVLSAADAETSTLEKKLACLKDEKKALMQQLLTGKRRVKVEAEEAVSA